MADRRNAGPRGRRFEKPKDFMGTIRKLLSYMGRYRVAVIIVMIFAIGSTIFNVIGPKILGNATTELFNGLVAKISGTGSIDFSNRAVRVQHVFRIYPGMGHVRRVAEDVFQDARGDQPEDQPYASGILRIQYGRRCAVQDH